MGQAKYRLGDIGANIFQSIALLYQKISLSVPEKQVHVLQRFGALLMTSVFLVYSTQINVWFQEQSATTNFFSKFIWDAIWALSIYLVFLSTIRNAQVTRKRFTAIGLLSLSFVMFYGLSGFFTTFGRFKMFGVFIVLIFPLASIDLQEEDFINDLSSFLDMYLIFSFLYFASSVLLSPYYGTPYKGLSNNQNGLGFYASSSIAVAVFLLITKYRETKLYNCYRIMIIGLMMTLIIVSQSRTSFLVALMLILVLLFRELMQRKYLSFFKTSLTIFFVIVLGILLFNFKESIDIANLESSYVSFSENRGTEVILPSGTDRNILDRFAIGDLPDEVEDETSELSRLFRILDRLSTGRLSIWRTFAHNTSWFGSESVALEIIGHNNLTAITAHNIFIQVTYDIGYIGGAFYLVLCILCLIYSLRYLFQRTLSSVEINLMVMTLLHWGVGFLSSMTYPNLHFNAHLFFIAIVPFMFTKVEINRTVDRSKSSTLEV